VGVVTGQTLLKIGYLLHGGQHYDVSWLKSYTFKGVFYLTSSKGTV